MWGVGGGFHLRGAVESSKLGLGQESVEDVAHFVEERDDVVVAHQRGLGRGRFGEVGDHCGERVAP